MPKIIGVFSVFFIVLIFTACEVVDAPHERVGTALSEDTVLDVTRFRTNVITGEYGEAPTIHFTESVRDLETLIEKQQERYDIREPFEEALTKYDETYFENHVLLVAVFEEGSGSIGHSVSDVTIDDEGMLRVYVNRHIPEIGTADMAGWHILVPVERGEVPYQDAKLYVDHKEHDSVHIFRTDLFAFYDDVESVHAFDNLEDFRSYIDEVKNFYQLHIEGTFFDHIRRYDEAFFDLHSLVVITLEEPSGSIRHVVKDYSVDDEVLTVSIERRIPEVGTDDMANWHVLIELPNDQFDYKDVEIEITSHHID